MVTSGTKKTKMGSLKRKPLSEQVYETVKGALLSGSFAPGDRINEVDLAAQLDVSKTPVREALRRLEAEDFITITPWRGAIVNEFARKQIVEIYQCREALEGLAARLAADTIDSRGLSRLRKILMQAQNAKAPIKLAELNSQFHDMILNYAKNSKLQSMLSLLNDVILRDRNITAFNVKRRDEILDEHLEILDALEGADSVRAEACARRHVQNGLEMAKRMLDQESSQ